MSELSNRIKKHTSKSRETTLLIKELFLHFFYLITFIRGKYLSCTHMLYTYKNAL
jgi:hypothetical protein